MLPIRKKCGRIKSESRWKVLNKVLRLSETVPDTHDTIFTTVKIGKSIGVYSGVYEYTQEIPGTNTEYTEYTRYLGIS